MINTNDITVINSNAIYDNQLIEFETVPMSSKVEKLVFFLIESKSVSVVYICIPFSPFKKRRLKVKFKFRGPGKPQVD